MIRSLVILCAALSMSGCAGWFIAAAATTANIVTDTRTTDNRLRPRETIRDDRKHLAKFALPDFVKQQFGFAMALVNPSAVAHTAFESPCAHGAILWSGIQQRVRVIKQKDCDPENHNRHGNRGVTKGFQTVAQNKRMYVLHDDADQ